MDILPPSLHNSMIRTDAADGTERPWRARVPRAILLLCAVGVALLSGSSTPRAQGCGFNAIVCENNLTGNPASEWDISGVGDSTIQGFATDISVNKGGVVHF